MEIDTHMIIGCNKFVAKFNYYYYFFSLELIDVLFSDTSATKYQVLSRWMKHLIFAHKQRHPGIVDHTNTHKFVRIFVFRFDAKNAKN